MALLLFLAGLIGAIGIGVGLPFGRRPSAGGGGGAGELQHTLLTLNNY